MKIILQPNMVVFTYFCFLHSATKRSHESETDQDRNVEHQDLNTTDLGDQQSCILAKLLVTASFKSKKLRVLENEPIEPGTCVNQQKLYSIKPCDSDPKHDDSTSSSTANGEESSLDMNSSEEHLSSGNNVSTPNSNTNIDKTIKYESIAVQTDNDSIPVNPGRSNACKSCGIPNCFYCNIFRDLETSFGQITQNENEVVPIVDFEAFREHYMNFKEKSEGSQTSNKLNNYAICASEVNCIGYNILNTSKLDLPVRKKAVNLYTEKCCTFIEGKIPKIREYLANHNNEKLNLAYRPNFDDPLNYVDLINTCIEDIELKETAMSIAYNKRKIDDESYTNFAHDYVDFLSKILCFIRIIAHMPEFIFFIEDRIRLNRALVKMDIHGISNILKEYCLLKDVLNEYSLYLKLISMNEKSKNNAGTITEQTLSTSNNCIFQGDNALLWEYRNDPARLKENFEGSIQNLRIHIKNSMTDKKSNRYVLYDSAMKMRYGSGLVDNRNMVRIGIQFILAFTQKTEVNLEKTALKDKNFNLNVLLDNITTYRSNTIMTLQLVINYLKFTKITHQKITLISLIWRQKEMIIVDQSDLKNLQWVKYGEICKLFLQQFFAIARNEE